MRRLLIASCGRIGISLANYLDSDVYEIYAMRRHIEQLPNIVKALRVDLMDQVAVAAALATHHFDDVVISVSTGGYQSSHYLNALHCVQNLVQALVQKPPQRVFYLSSTRVYGHNRGEWVNERSQVSPNDFAGEYLLLNENYISSHLNATTILRLSGIYGPEYNYLIKRVLQDPNAVHKQEAVYTNRIHTADVVGFIAYLLSQQDAIASLYILSDGRPVLKPKLWLWLQKTLGEMQPELLANNQTLSTAVPKQTKLRRQSYHRRFSNKLMLSTAYKLHYANYRAGYADLCSAI